MFGKPTLATVPPSFKAGNLGQLSLRDDVCVMDEIVFSSALLTKYVTPRMIEPSPLVELRSEHRSQFYFVSLLRKYGKVNFGDFRTR